MDVYQINEKHGRDGWTGAFVLATEVKSWGIVGFVHMIDDHEHHSEAFIRLPFDQIDFIGKAALEPESS